MKTSQKELFKYADQIPTVSWGDLRNRSPQQAAEAVGAKWSGETFQVQMLGIQYSIDPTNMRITVADHADQRVSYQAGVVLLTTLSISKGVPPSGRMAVPQELPGGRMFFTGAHTLALGPLVKYFEENSNQLIDHALGIGGELIEGADFAIRLPGLPYVPLYILFWRGGRDFLFWKWHGVKKEGNNDRPTFRYDSRA